MQVSQYKSVFHLTISIIYIQKYKVKNVMCLQIYIYMYLKLIVIYEIIES